MIINTGIIAGKTLLSKISTKENPFDYHFILVSIRSINRILLIYIGSTITRLYVQALKKSIFSPHYPGCNPSPTPAPAPREAQRG